MEKGRTEVKELQISELYRRKKWKMCAMAQLTHPSLRLHRTVARLSSDQHA